MDSDIVDGNKIPLQPPKTLQGSEFEHERQVEQQIEKQKQSMKAAINDAILLLQDSKYDLAIMPGLKSLKIAMQIFGENSLELIEPYFVLGEASTGLGKFKQATEYLTYAKWIVQKNPNCDDIIRSKLYRHFGMLYMLKGDHKEAIRYISNEIFHLSVVHGPESIITAAAYYRLGSVFLSNGEADKVLALYEKVAEIWFRFLGELMKKDPSALDTALQEMTPSFEHEANNMLKHILHIRQQALGQSHRETADVYYILSMFLCCISHDFENALKCADMASQVYETALGSAHLTSRNAKETIRIIKEKADLFGL